MMSSFFSLFFLSLYWTLIAVLIVMYFSDPDIFTRRRK